MKRPFRTMLRLSKSQRSLVAEKLADLANLAAAGLVFGQLIGGSSQGWSSVAIGIGGAVLWVVLFALALTVAREVRR